MKKQKKTGFHFTFRLLLTLTLLLQSQFNCFPLEQKTSTVPVFDDKSAFKYLVKQCDFGPRNPGSNGYFKCRDFLINTLKSYADEVSTQAFEFSYGKPSKTLTATNIIAKFQPKKTDRILLCAHWDTRPWADKDSMPKNVSLPILGANDGASGVAVLLEIARLLHQKKPLLGIDIVLFDGEDAGLAGTDQGWIQGSTFFVNNLNPVNYPRFGILLDMIGDADLSIYKEAYSWENARPIVEIVWNQAAELGIKEFKPQTQYAILDDHLPFLKAGIPCIDLIDFDYPYWHTMEDTPDRCSPASLGKTGKLLVNIIYKKD